tara:strand:+ start:124 stop:288 length:165 start_codon:yes stop_codon:yes gene_type:complete
MNNLLLTKKRVQKAERLHKAQIAAMKNGVFASYKRSFFEDSQKQFRNDILDQET